jgi:CBS-domain-containing membrane protein
MGSPPREPWPTSWMPLHQASRLLLEQRARALPIVDREGHVIGMLGEEELLVRFGPRRRPWWHVFASRDQNHLVTAERTRLRRGGYSAAPGARAR